MSPARTFGGGRYVVRRELGRGGQKVVFLVHDTSLNRECALALLPAESLHPEDAARLRQEARTLAQMGAQPHVVTVFDLGEDEGSPYLVCELVPGGDLAHLLEHAGGTLPIDRALALAADILRGLCAAHERGIIHRDLKPSNVWIDEKGRAKLGDFGVALAPDRPKVTATGAVTGTPAYCAPEQLGSAGVDGRADLYALGCLLYELLVGRPPFLGSVVSVISQQLHASPTPPSALLPDLPKDLDQLVLRLLAKDPAQRPQTAQEALSLVEAIAGELTSPGPTLVRAEPATVTTQPQLLVSPSPPTHPIGTRVTARRSQVARLFLGLALIAAPIGGMLALSKVLNPVASFPRRVAVLAMKTGERSVAADTAWMITSRLIEEIDRFSDFRPVSAIGISIARKAVLGGNGVLPEPSEAVTLAARLEADTVAAISVSEVAEGNLELQAQVFDTADPGNGTAGKRVRISKAELDAAGPLRVAQTVVEALERHWGRATMAPEPGVAPSREVKLDAFARSMVGEQYCIVGRFDLCENAFRELLREDPDNAFYLMKLACAVSYQDRPEELAALVKQAESLSGKLTNRRAMLLYQQDMAWIEAEELLRKGDKEQVKKLAVRMLELDRELATVYQDPWGHLYAAAVHQLFLEDIPTARQEYAEVRRMDPSLFPPYYEEARLLIGDGKNPTGKQDAARLIFTFVRCFPESELVKVAWTTVHQYGLVEPSEPVVCPGA